MIAHRKMVEKNDIGHKKGVMDARIANLQKVQFKNYYRPQEYVEKPRYNSTWEKKEEVFT